MSFIMMLTFTCACILSFTLNMILSLTLELTLTLNRVILDYNLDISHKSYDIHIHFYIHDDLYVDLGLKYDLD